MADEIDISKPKEPPKPVRVGGESLADRILPHLKKIIIGVIILAVVVSVVFGFRAWKQSKQAAETEKVAAVLALGQRPVAASGAPADPKTPTFASTKERATALLDEMAKQGTDALGAAYRAGLLLDAGKIDDAIAEYKKGVGGEGIEGIAAREGLGIALEAKAASEKDPAVWQRTLEEALAAYAAMQPNKDGERRAYALYHQGRVQETLRKVTEAKVLYEEAKASGGAGSEIGQLIEKRLAGLGAS